MTRINEIGEKQENPDANKNKLKIDKQSSARIIKRSLWSNASKTSKKVMKSQVNEMINSTLATVVTIGGVNGKMNDVKRELDETEEINRDEVTEKGSKRLKV